MSKQSKSPTELLLPKGKSNLCSVEDLQACFARNKSLPKEEQSIGMDKFFITYAKDLKLDMVWIEKKEAVKAVNLSTQKKEKKVLTKEQKEAAEKKKDKEHKQTCAELGVGKEKVEEILDQIKATYKDSAEGDVSYADSFMDMESKDIKEKFEGQIDLSDFQALIAELTIKEKQNLKSNMKIADMKGLLILIYQNSTQLSMERVCEDLQILDCYGGPSKTKGFIYRDVHLLLNEFPAMRNCVFSYTALYNSQKGIRKRILAMSQNDRNWWKGVQVQEDAPDLESYNEDIHLGDTLSQDEIREMARKADEIAEKALKGSVGMSDN